MRGAVTRKCSGGVFLFVAVVEPIEAALEEAFNEVARWFEPRGVWAVECVIKGAAGNIAAGPDGAGDCRQASGWLLAGLLIWAEYLLYGPGDDVVRQFSKSRCGFIGPDDAPVREGPDLPYQVFRE